MVYTILFQRSSFEIFVQELLPSLGNFIFYFSLRKNNKSFFFPRSPIYYLSSRKLTLNYYLNFSWKNWKLKIFNFYFKNWTSIIDLIFNIENFIRELDIKLNSKLVKVNFQSQNAIENWMDEIYAVRVRVPNG